MIEIEDIPVLRDPIMISAFEGWNDAGEGASNAVEHLISAWSAELVAVLDPEEYYDFQVNRPRRIVAGDRSIIRFPTTEILLARDTPMQRDVLFVRGIEPSIRWRTFATDLLDFAVQQGVSLYLGLGSLLADVPHTRPLPVMVTSEDPDLAASMDARPSTYEGPSGITGVMAERAHAKAHIPTVSLWVPVPHYAGGAPSPKAVHALVSKLEEILDCVIDDSELEEAAKAWERGVAELAESDEEIATYVRELEESQDIVEMPEASGDAIADEFERYLRRRRGEGHAPG